MKNINYKKVLLFTFLQILTMLIVFFTLNSWSQIKQSLNGEIPPLAVWMANSFTNSNFIVMALLSITFFMNTLKRHKTLAEKQSKYTE